MRVLDPGHRYLLDSLDGGEPRELVFVKREGDGYPGNAGHHPGVIIQEVLRALIERGEYVNGQIPCDETTAAIAHLRAAMMLLEKRAARRHGRDTRPLVASLIPIDRLPVHVGCGHIGCVGECGR